jgi:hypothetical protein
VRGRTTMRRAKRLEHATRDGSGLMADR